MKINLLLVSVFTGTFFLGNAQNELDAYRYSNTYVQGSARFDAMGGAFGALGAESGCIAINPAGFGKYSTTSVAFGLNSTATKVTSNYYDNSTSFSSVKTRVPNMNAVIVSDVSGGNSGFLYSQVFLGLNRVANFNNSFSYQGQQYESLLDVFCNDANGIAEEDLYYYLPFGASLAYQTYAINPDASGTTYYPDLTSGDMIHNRSVFQRGGINEFYVGLSGNYLDKLLLGISFSYNSLNFYENIAHKETLIETNGVSLRSFMYNTNVRSKGGGASVKIGATLIPTEFIRLGLSIHTPTFYEITDEYYADMSAEHVDGIRYVPTGYEGIGKYKYRIWTPTKLVGSMAFIFGDHGSIGVDAEYMNYGWARIKNTNDEAYASTNYGNTNASIRSNLNGVINLRVGGELVIGSVFFIRGGYGYFPKGNLFIQDYGKKYNQSISGGIGFRLNKMYLDLSARYLMSTSVYYAFQESRVNLDITNLTFNAGIRYKFDY